MKKLFYLFVAALCCGLCACSDSDDYNADTAESYYKPLEGERMVASVKTTNTIGGRDYYWEHKFEYDAQGRIKNINSVMRHHTEVVFANTSRFYECNITSEAKYYYRGDLLEVYYNVKKEYPEYPAWNEQENAIDRGRFSEAGVLATFSAMDLVYSGNLLSAAYSDNGYEYALKRDASGDVAGYVVTDINESKVLADNAFKYGYSHYPNRTNFDFSAYFGYWGMEQAVYANRSPYYASYQLAAFGMFGMTSPYLPLSLLGKDEYGDEAYVNGKWEFDSQNFPVSFVDATGRRTEITYVD